MKKTKTIKKDILIDQENQIDPSNNGSAEKIENQIRIDELSDEKLEILTENWRLVSLINHGVSIKKAKSQVSSNQSERSIRNLVKRYKTQGAKAITDGRWNRTNPTLVLVNEVKNIILGFYYTYTAAGPRLIWKKTCAECQSRKLKEPCESSVKKYLKSLPEPFKLFRGGKNGIRKWEQTAAPVIRYENTTYANERWQGDHSPLPTWVRVKIDDKWIVSRVHISVLLDAHSRAIPGYVVSCKYPDSWTISLLFYEAILKKSAYWRICGIPFIFQSDRGKDFLSKSVGAVLTKLKVIFDPDDPYYPNLKGKVERFFETLDIGLLRGLPGHTLSIGTTEGAAQKRIHELLTLQQLDKEIEKWIIEEYHQTIHSETNRKPAELWEETVHLRLPENEEDLNLLLLKEDIERTIINIGIKLKYKEQNHVYWSPELVYYFGQKVRLAYNPEDLESVLVYCADTGKRLCEAFDMNSPNSPYTIDDIKTAKKQVRQGLAERIKGYREEIKVEDRRDTRKKEWQEARKKVSEEAVKSETKSEVMTDDKEIMLLLEKLKKRDQAKF